MPVGGYFTRKHQTNLKSDKKKKLQNGFFMTQTRELLFAEDEQFYAVVEKSLGDARFLLKCSDNEQRVGKVRGVMRRRVWVNAGDIVLMSLRAFELGSERSDIIHKYSIDEARVLESYGEINAVLFNSQDLTTKRDPNHDDADDYNIFDI